MRLSAALLNAWQIIESNYSSTAPAVDCFGIACRPWEQAAIAWDTVGVLEKLYYDPVTNKYSKDYDQVIAILRQCMGAQNQVPGELDEESDVHAIWWGAILTAQADEKQNRLNR